MITLRYTDPKYGFVLRIPDWWKPYLVVKRSGKSGDMDYDVQFLFKYGGKVYTDIFSMSVYRMTRKQWRDKGYDESPSILVAERNGRIFAYSTPEEPPEEFFDENSEDGYDKKYARPLNLLRRMINDEVPGIAKAIKFVIKKPRTIKKARK